MFFRILLIIAFSGMSFSCVKHEKAAKKSDFIILENLSLLKNVEVALIDWKKSHGNYPSNIEVVFLEEPVLGSMVLSSEEKNGIKWLYEAGSNNESCIFESSKKVEGVYLILNIVGDKSTIEKRREGSVVSDL